MKDLTPNNSEKIKAFCQKIGIAPEDTAIILDCKIGSLSYCLYSYLLTHQPQLLLSIIGKSKKKRRLFLEFFVRYAVEHQDKYVDYLGGSTDDYYRHFRDIAIWLEACKSTYGEIGIDEANWVINSLTLYVVRIGRLQYERSTHVHDYTPELKKHLGTTTAYTIHIPRDGRLDIDEVKSSLKRASEHLGQEIFFCRSWLLSPDLDSLLPQGSNIRAFSQLFTPMGSVESRQIEQYLFDKVLGNPNDYVATTSLQLAVKNHLLQGGKIREGMGIIEVSKL